MTKITESLLSFPVVNVDIACGVKRWEQIHVVVVFVLSLLKCLSKYK